MFDNSEYSLVPEKDEDGNETGYYTREPDGVSGMTVSALSNFCGLAPGSTSAVSTWLKLIESSDPETNTLPESMKPYAGKVLRLETNDLQGRLIIPDEACQSIAEYYAFDARDYSGQKVARDNFRVISKAGMRLFIWSKTGYKLKPESNQVIPYWYQRTKIALSDPDKPIQSGYFCVYLEMIDFFQQMETRLGFVMPDINPVTDEHLVPDISIASRFNDWLRSDKDFPKSQRLKFLKSTEIIDFRPQRFNKDKVTKQNILMPAGKHCFEIRMYNHVYPTSSHGKYQVQSARSYPRKYLEIFLYYFEEIYIPTFFKDYLFDKSLDAWNQIESTLKLMNFTQKNALKHTLVAKLFPLLPPGK